MDWFDVVHPSWHEVFEGHRAGIHEIARKTALQNILPTSEFVLRAFSSPLQEIKVVIFGQDPYPNEAHACGLAFSVNRETDPLPKSLQNIFKELQSDFGGDLRVNGDLSDWADQGVALINRVLTVKVGESASHVGLGWELLTNDVAMELAKRGVIAILWGNHARELESFFPDNQKIVGVHPSPLSAYRGFFGSKPFTRANQLLVAQGRPAIDWLSSDVNRVSRSKC